MASCFLYTQTHSYGWQTESGISMEWHWGMFPLAIIERYLWEICVEWEFLFAQLKIQYSPSGMVRHEVQSQGNEMLHHHTNIVMLEGTQSKMMMNSYSRSCIVDIKWLYFSMVVHWPFCICHSLRYPTTGNFTNHQLPFGRVVGLPGKHTGTDDYQRNEGQTICLKPIDL